MNKLLIDLGRSLNTPRVSIIPLVAFVEATEARKKSIVKDQKRPHTFKVAPYATARAAIRKYVENEFDQDCILAGIERLHNRNAESQWARRDTQNSILALHRFIDSNFPSHLGKVRCSFSKAAIKEIYFYGVSITVAPDLVMRWEENGKRYVGAVKFRISKEPYSGYSGTLAASLLAYYVRYSIAEPGEIVDNSHCLFCDVMASTLFSAPENIELYMQAVKTACLEYVKLWDAA